MTELVVDGISKSYGAAIAIQDVTFTVGKGEFVTLLGPSGCGKSTTLAASSRITDADDGHIRAGDGPSSMRTESPSRPKRAISAWCFSPMPSGRTCPSAKTCSFL